ncbi:MAG TPA: PAS domain S-box protein, partial [Polyangiales bacterium]|nr:PAS domain S-box protein [Polyangiales bacterium]
MAATSVVGHEFFRSLVRETAAASGLRCALIAALSETAPPRMETIAVWDRGGLAAPVELALEQSACGRVLAERALLCNGDAQERFPNDALLRSTHARSLIGVALLSASGAPIGVLMGLHDGLLDHAVFAKSILTIFAGRASSEVERMRVDAALRQSEENLRATVELTPHVAVQWYDRQGRIERWNPASAKMFGWSAEEAVGKTLDELIHTKEEAAEFLDLLRELDETGVPAGPSEFRFRRRDGSEGTCLSTAFKIPGVPSGPRFVCMDIDVSVHKRTEAALRVSAERYRLLVENSSDLVCEVYGGGRLLYVSPRFESVLGYSPTELLGEDLLGLVHPDDVSNVAAQFTRTEATVVFRARHKQGHVCWLEATRRSYRTSAGDELGVVIARDVSERKRAEQQKAELEAQLRQTQKLESLGTLAGGIAHDFNNILGAIFAYSELAAIDAEKPERVRSRLTELDKAARRARDLVQQILSFSRAQRQERTAVALADVLEETLRFLRSTLPSTIEIDARLSRQTPRVLAAPVQMHQVVLNLCMNAAHAMRDKPGKLTVVLEPA